MADGESANKSLSQDDRPVFLVRREYPLRKPESQLEEGSYPLRRVIVVERE